MIFALDFPDRQKSRGRQRVLRRAAEEFCKRRQRFDFSQGVVLRTGSGIIPMPWNQQVNKRLPSK